jgi:flavin reductase (DIM6/NTAB) family NADH-FMN oxidoreductase RutF
VLVENVVAHAECSVESITDAGDHDVFLARVTFGACYEGTPLMYFRRAYAAWPHAEELRTA